MIKKILITILLISCFRFVYCQDTLVSTENIVDTTEVYKAVDQMPQFPGGDGAMMQYISQNLKYPILSQDEVLNSRIIVQFVVEKDGSISDIKIVRSIQKDFDNMVVDLIKSMPKWTPGEQNGKKVRVSYLLPITICLQK